jgi:hypothetical protein
LGLDSIVKNKNKTSKTRETEEKIGVIVGKQKPGLFSALTLGLVLLIAASAITANNNSESPAVTTESRSAQLAID